eukprot:30936-Pelagococcus_subviridis.AAC.29
MLRAPFEGVRLRVLMGTGAGVAFALVVGVLRRAVLDLGVRRRVRARPQASEQPVREPWGLRHDARSIRVSAAAAPRQISVAKRRDVDGSFFVPRTT